MGLIHTARAGFKFALTSQPAQHNYRKLKDVLHRVAHSRAPDYTWAALVALVHLAKRVGSYMRRIYSPI